MFLRVLLFAIVTALSTSFALAHGGHLGELAGHSHWIGVAALAGAALIAAGIALRDKRRKKASEENTSDEEAEQEIEAAQ